MDMLLSIPEGLLSGLQAQSEISELLDDLYYDGLVCSWDIGAFNKDPVAVLGAME